MSDNDLFRFVSLRGALDGMTIDPSADVQDLAVVERLTEVDLDPVRPSPSAIRKIFNMHTFDASELERLTLAQAADAIDKIERLSFVALERLQVAADPRPVTFPDAARSRRFLDAYRAVTDSWLAIRLRLAGEVTLGEIPADTQVVLARHEELIRAGHIGFLLVNRPDSLRTAGMAENLWRAPIVLPWVWRDAAHVKRTTVHRAGDEHTSVAGSRARDRAAELRNFAELERRIVHTERIQREATDLLLDLERAGDPVDRLSLSPKFYAELESRLDPDARAILTRAVGANGASRPKSLSRLDAALDVGKVVRDAIDERAHEGFLLSWVPELVGSRTDELLQEDFSKQPVPVKMPRSTAAYFLGLDAWIEAQAQTIEAIHDIYMNAINDGHATAVAEAMALKDSVAGTSSQSVVSRVSQLESTRTDLAQRFAFEGHKLGQVLAATLFILFFGPVKKIGRPIQTKPEKKQAYFEFATIGGSISVGSYEEITVQPFAKIQPGMQDFVDVLIETLSDPTKQKDTSFLESAGGHKGTAHVRLLQYLAKLEKELNRLPVPK